MLRQRELIFIGLCLLVGLCLRLSNFEFFTTSYLPDHFNFIDTDCYYQLRRLVHFLSSFPSVLNWDPGADWPGGAPIDWGVGYLFLLGVPLKILGVQTFAGVEIGACLIMIVLGLGVCAMIWSLGRKFFSSTDSQMGILLLFLAVTNHLLTRFSCLGEIDHHLLEIALPVLLLWIAFPLIEQKDLRSFYYGRWFLLAFVVAYFLSVSSSSLFAIAAFFGSLVFIWGKKELHSKGLGAMAITTLSLITLLAFWNHSRTNAWFSIDHASFFHLFIVGLLAVSSLISLWLPKMWRVSTVIAVMGATAVLVSFDFFPAFSGSVKGALYYVFAKSGALSQVFESQSIFTDWDEINFNFAIVNFGYGIFLLPLIWILSLTPFRKTMMERALFFNLFILSWPSVSQKRFSHLMAGLYLIFLVWCFERAVDFFKSRQIRIQIPLALFFVGLTIIPQFGSGFAPMGSPRDRIDLEIARLFISRLPPQDMTEEKVWKRLSGKEEVSFGIWANPNLGHLVQYATGYGVVTNSFYHPESFDRDFSYRKIEATEDFKERLKKDRVRYLLLTDDFPFLELQEKLRGIDSSSWLHRSGSRENGSDRIVYQMPYLEKFAWVRLLIAGTDAYEKDGFSMLSAATININYPLYRFVRAVEFSSKE